MGGCHRRALRRRTKRSIGDLAAACALLLAASLTGCATRPCAYTYRAPVLSSVHAPDLPRRGAFTSARECVARDEAAVEPADAASEPKPVAWPEPRAYGVVYFRGASASSLMAQVDLGAGLNAHMTVQCLGGGRVLKTWSGQTRWRGTVPDDYQGTVDGRRITWEDGEPLGVRVETDARGRGGKELEHWVADGCDTIMLWLAPRGVAAGASPTGGPGQADKKRSNAGPSAPARATTTPGTRSGAAGAAGAAGAGRSAAGQPGGSAGGKAGGVTAERGGVDGEFTRITGEAHGAAHGARGGDGDRDDHGLRGGSGLIGLINVPAALRPLAEVLLIMKDAQPGVLAGQWTKKAAGKAPELLRRELHEEAAAYTKGRLRKLAPQLNADRAFQHLSPIEQERFLRAMRWDMERIYFHRVEEGALSTIADLETRLAGKVADSTRTQLQSSLTQARTVLDAAKVKPIAGRLPVNHRYAGKAMPADKLPNEYRAKGLRLTEDGYPDFSPHAIQLPNGQTSAKIKLSGNAETDRLTASRAAGFTPPKAPVDHVWHHHQDGTTMILVPRKLHESASHTGGRAHYRHITGDLKAYE